MKLSIVVLAVSASSASAFAPSVNAPPQQRLLSSSQLNVMTKGKVAPFRKSLSSLTKDNFSSTLSEIESFLTEEAGSELYAKTMRRIKVKARALGVNVPSNYAREAKATIKRRGKQDAFVTAKVEAAAAAAAAEAEAAAAAAAAEAEAKAAAAAAALEPAEEVVA